MLQSTESSFVELFASLPRLARFTSLAERLRAAAETLQADGWTGVQIVLFGRHASETAIACGEISFVLHPEALSRLRNQFTEIVLERQVSGIAFVPAAQRNDFELFGTSMTGIVHDCVIVPLAAKEREIGCLLLNAPTVVKRPREGLRIWADVLASMIETDLQSTFYGQLEYVMAALQGINDTNAILRIIVELLTNEFGATCVAWQVAEPRWRMAALMPQSASEPMIAFQQIDFRSKQLSRINGMLVAPLSIDTRPWGALAIDEGAIEGERLRFLQTVVYHLEVALSTAESFNKQLLLAQESAELCEAGRTLLGFTRMEPLAQAISRLAVNLADADEAALYVATDDNFARIGCAPYDTASMSVDIQSLQWAREQGQCYASNDERLIVVPLHEASEFITARFAALVVSRFAMSECFTANHTRKLEAFGALCAMALRNVRLYEEASEANLALSDINAFKDDLLAMFTHDFKGPLTVISGYGELVLEKLEGDERENLGIILRQVKRLATLADDALALARAQAAGFVLQLEHGELVTFVADVLRSSLGTQAHRIKTNLRVPSVMLAFDPIAMRHVLENILGNALKYSSQSITLEIDVDGSDAVIAVRDSGIGIPAEELPNVFGRFARASNARRRGISGSGVGLYLAKRLIEQHRGSISVASIEGEGSTFEIRLPVGEGRNSGA